MHIFEIRNIYENFIKISKSCILMFHISKFSCAYDNIIKINRKFLLNHWK